MSILGDLFNSMASKPHLQPKERNESIHSGYTGFSTRNFSIDTAQSAKYTQVGSPASGTCKASFRRVSSGQKLALFNWNHPYRRCHRIAMTSCALHATLCAAAVADRPSAVRCYGPGRDGRVVPYPGGGSEA